MFGLPKDLKPKEITVKIENIMKRRSFEDSPPMSSIKRHRTVNRYNDSSNESGLSDYVSRRSRTPHSHRASRYSEIDEFGQSMDLERSHSTYKVLCISALHPEASDEQVKETLYREYRKFGEFSIKISYELDKRIAYVCFRRSKDAEDAIHSKPRISLFDKIALVAPVYKRRNSRDHHESRARRSQSLNCSPDFEKYYPAFTEEHRLIDRFYEMLPYGIVPSMQPPQVFREIGLPPLNPRELMIPRQPLMHHMAPHSVQMHALYGPPRHRMPQFRPYPQSRLMHDKKDRFPNYLHHIPPEDDPLATRTLFAGNLEYDISNDELHRLFCRYGVVEDIDVKRPLPGTGSSYAFVRYENLDMAHRAKVEISGYYIGKNQCKIGYGKSILSKRIFISGLGPWTSHAQLEQEFDRFGVIKKIDYVKGDICAYIQFESIDAATAAVNQMRGVALEGLEYKLRTDYAEDSVYDSPPLIYSTESKLSQDDIAAAPTGDSEELTRKNKYALSWPVYKDPLNDFRSYHKDHTEYIEESRGFGNHENSHSVSDISSSRSPLDLLINSDVESEEGTKRSIGPLDSVHTLEHLACKCSDVWQGSLVLKRSQFPANCYLISGDTNVINSMMKDEDGKSILRITQRLRLDESKLKDISKRIITAEMHAIFLAMPYSSNSISNDDVSEQIRQLHNLVSYLKQKEAAGVISLINKDNKSAGVLYAFPPCEYSAKLLKQIAKNLSSDTLKYDDHLVVVVVSGNI